jgi:GGDEF domain-containing protein
VVSSIDDASELAQAEQRLRASLDKLNSSGHLDFELGFSLGAGVFDPANDIDAAGFRRRLDAILYAEKRIKHGDDATGQFARVA